MRSANSGFDCPWGPRSIISDGKDGLLVENGNVQEMADALVRLMADEPLRHLMGEAGMKNVQRFSIEKIAERWKVLFDSL